MPLLLAGSTLMRDDTFPREIRFEIVPCCIVYAMCGAGSRADVRPDSPADQALAAVTPLLRRCYLDRTTTKV